MIYDPVEITCLEAKLAQLKKTLNATGAKMTCAKAAEAIGLSDEWSHNDREKFSMICQSLYEREYPLRRLRPRQLELHHHAERQQRLELGRSRLGLGQAAAARSQGIPMTRPPQRYDGGVG